jgi:signal transduction histidine kinase
MQAQDNERRHIARELHDSAGQLLTVLSMNLARLSQTAKETAPELEQGLHDVDALIQKLTQEIRTTSYLLHPPLLDEAGLLQALDWYIQGLRERTNLEIALNVAKDFGRLSSDMELAMFRVVQECLTNIHRHSQSTKATIRIALDGGNVFLEVEDEGKGLTAERLVEIRTRKSGVGISGMRERVRQFGGDLHIESGETGTTVSVTFPYAETATAGRIN